MSTDRFFCVTLVGGQFVFAGLSEWEPWDPAKFHWRSGAEIDSLSTPSVKIRTTEELLAYIKNFVETDTVQAVWIHESLEAEAQQYYAFKRGTVKAFGENMLRYKNVRERFSTAHISDQTSLRQKTESLKIGVESMRQQAGSQDPAHPVLSTIEIALSIMHHLDQQLDSLPREEAFSREMEFVYLVAIFDAFVGHWRVDMGLDDGRWLVDAEPKNIRSTCEELKMLVNFPPDFDAKLGEMRARRDVLVHRGGIAGTRYCERTSHPECLGQRLEVTDDYLNTAERFISDLVWDELVPKTPPLWPSRC